MKLWQVIPTGAPSAPQPNLTQSLNYHDHLDGENDHVDVGDDNDDAHLMMVYIGRNGMPPTKHDHMVSMLQ